MIAYLWLLLVLPKLSARELTIAPPAPPFEYLVLGIGFECIDANGQPMHGPVYTDAYCTYDGGLR